MTKEPSWRAKAMYIVFACALVFGMSAAILPDQPSVDAQGEPTELNPWFLADETVVDVGEVVTFENLTAGGVPPYIMAEWDFDADGVIDTTLTGTHAWVMANVTWAYGEAGVYSPILQMTDSTTATM
jgi:hypothetical protein